ANEFRTSLVAKFTEEEIKIMKQNNKYLVLGDDVSLDLYTLKLFLVLQVGQFEMEMTESSTKKTYNCNWKESLEQSIQIFCPTLSSNSPTSIFKSATKVEIAFT
ncbi:hypothetical protein SNEBB_004934, partial [Seison nebaliae]